MITDEMHLLHHKRDRLIGAKGANMYSFIGIVESNRVESNRNWDALSLLLSAVIRSTPVGWMNGMIFSQVARVERLETMRCVAI